MSLLSVALLAAGVLIAIFCLIKREELALRRATHPHGTAEAIWSGRERRQHPRYVLSCAVRYRVQAAARPGQAQAHVWDVSMGGVALRLRERVAPGARLDLEIMLAETPAIRAQADVRWSRELPRQHLLAPREFLTGTQFVGVPAQDLSRLLAHAAQHKEGG